MFSYLKSLTPMQSIAIVMAILGVLGGATAQLNDLLGPTLAHTVVTASSFLTTLLSAIMVPLTGQSAQLKAVNDMPGIQQIIVNKNANQTLAATAVDPNSKYEAAPEAQKAVETTAKGS